MYRVSAEDLDKYAVYEEYFGGYHVYGYYRTREEAKKAAAELNVAEKESGMGRFDLFLSICVFVTAITVLIAFLVG